LDRQRIDKWLWHARMLRSRGDAAAFVNAGHVRLNGKRVTAASQLVHPGDVLTLALDRSVRLIEVAGFRERRGGAAEARAIYRDLTTASGPRASAAGDNSPMLGAPRGKGP
jgi:ribosome-associated heat shock protein Hsp15